MTGRPEELAPLISALEERATESRARAQLDPGSSPKPVEMTVEVVDRVVSWFRSSPACSCPCHRDPRPVDHFHESPCCALVTEMQVFEEQEELRVRQQMEWDALPLFKETVRCPKCGHDEAMSQYCSKTTRVEPTLFGAQGFACEWTAPGQRDHLHRACRRCRYMWTERPLDDREGAR